jgi:MFS family permease
LKTQTDLEKRNLFFFFTGLLFAGIVSTALNGTFHNYLNDIFGITADQRGALEFPRELPGLLAVFIVGSVIFLGEKRILTAAILITGTGLLGLGFFSPSYAYMILFMFIWSLGQHIHMSIFEPVIMDISRDKKKGTILGRANAFRSLGIIIGTVFIFVFMGIFKVSYDLMYLGAFFICIISAFFYSKLRIKTGNNKKFAFKFVFKKKYILFYLLSVTFGVRKQLFLVFAPWLLIKFFNRQPQDLAVLLFLSAVIGFFAKPYLGKLIDHFGERKVLMTDALLIIFLCILYALVPMNLPFLPALIILYSAYILDDLLFSLRTARTTYLYKIAESKEDITPTISMGISIEHLVSMATPVFAGIIWINAGYYWVFIIAACVSLISGTLSFFLPKNT